MIAVIRMLSLLLVVGFVAFASSPSFGQSELTAIRVASAPNDDVTPLLWAQHTHMFEKAGLNVEFVHMNSGSAVTAAVIGGSLDIGKSSILPLVSAHIHQLPISLVSPGELWLSGAPVSDLIVAKSSPIMSAKDLNGKVIAVQALRDFSEYALRNWVNANGGDASTLKLIEVPQSAILATLQEGRAAAANVSDPGLTSVMASNQTRILGAPNDAIGKRFLLTAWFSSNSYIASHHDAIKKFADVMAQAAAYTNTHHAETVPLTAPFWGINPAVLSHMSRAEISAKLDPKEIQPVVNLAASTAGLIDKPFDARDLIAPGL